MAIRKVTRLVKGVEKEVLGLDDILDQIGGRRGDSIDFLGLAEVLNIPLNVNNNPNPISLPDSFIGEDLNLDAGNATPTPTSLSYESTGGSKTVSIVSNGTYRISSFPSWLSVDRTFARGNRVFTFTAFDNSDLNTVNRSGDIVFSAGTELARVSVSQAGNPIVATIVPNTNQTVPSTADSDNIIVRLSNSLSIYPASITNEDGFTLSEPNITTSGGVVTYTYTLEWDATDLSRSTTFSINFYGSGYSDTLDVTYNQQEFTPVIDNLTPTELNFPSAGQTLSYSFESNTTWTATISSPSFAFKHSLQSDRNFTTNDITSSGNKTIYVKIGGNGAGGREGTSTITTTYSRDNVTKSVALAQAAAEQWDDNDITITGFAVASNGDITVPTVTTTGDIEYTIEYSTTATFDSTALVDVSSGFDLVSADTIRYVRVSVTVPSGYGNTGDPFTKTAEATQEGLPTFQSKQITMEATRAFAVNSYGKITSPSVSVPSGITYTLRHTTGDNNTGTLYTRFPKVSTAVTRYANVVVDVPAGYFNEGETVIKTVNTSQGAFDPTLAATTPNGFDSLAFAIGGETLSFVVNSNYTWVSTISTLGDDVFEQSFSQTSGFTTNNLTGGIASLESGTRNTTIYVRAPKNLVEPKVGSVQVETNFGSLDNNDSVTLTQEGEPTFTFDTWDGEVTISADGTVSVTKGNSLTTPTFTPASFARVSSATNRNVSVTITVPDGYNNHNSELTGTKTVSQPKFVPTLALSHTARSFTAGGSTTYYDVKDVGTNTTWTATITGDGFEHSTSQTSGFKTTAINGFELGDRIWVRAAGHEGTARTGTATVTTTQGWDDVSKEVDLTQAAAPTYTTSNISIVGFDVNSAGTISTPTVTTTGNIDYTITYTTGNNSGTEYTSAFPEVTSNITRYCNVTVTRPAGYQESGTSLTKTVSATQEAVPFSITIGNFSIPANGGNGYASVSIPSIYQSNISVTPSFVYRDTAPQINWVGSATYEANNRRVRISAVPNYIGQTGYDGTSRSITLTINSSWNNNSKTTSDTGIGTQNVGTPPVYAPNITSVSGTTTFSYNWTNNTTSRDISVTYETAVTSYNRPTTISFAFDSALFDFHDPNDNFNISNPYGNYKVATAKDNSGSTKTVKVYSNSTNSSPDSRSVDVTVTTSNSGGSDTSTITLTQYGNVIFNLENIPNLGDGQWSVLNLKTTSASSTYFNFNIPYIFDFMNNTAGSNFDRTNFGFFVNNGAARSTSSHKLTSGLKTFTLTPNNDILPIQDSMNFDSNQWVSIIKRDTRLGVETNVTDYMVGIVTGYGTNPFSGDKYISVSIPTTTGYIQTTDNTVNHTSWEINQISGDASTFPRLYTRNLNSTGVNRTTTIKLNDTNDNYGQDTLQKTITQPTAPISGHVNLPSSINSWLALGGTKTYSNADVSDTVRYFSVGIKTNWVGSFSITKSGSSSIWISTTYNGSAIATINTSSSTSNTAAFYIRYNSPPAGGTYSAEITITGEGTSTTLNVNLSNPSATNPGDGTKPPINKL